MYCATSKSDPLNFFKRLVIFFKGTFVSFPQISFFGFSPADAAGYLQECEFFPVMHTPDFFHLYEIPVQPTMCVACLAVLAQLAVPIHNELPAVWELSLQSGWFMSTLGFFFSLRDESN